MSPLLHQTNTALFTNYFIHGGQYYLIYFYSPQHFAQFRARRRTHSLFVDSLSFKDTGALRCEGDLPAHTSVGFPSVRNWRLPRASGLDWGAPSPLFSWLFISGLIATPITWIIINRPCFLLGSELLGTIRSLSECGPRGSLPTRFLACGCAPYLTFELNVMNDDTVYTTLSTGGSSAQPRTSSTLAKPRAEMKARLGGFWDSVQMGRDSCMSPNVSLTASQRQTHNKLLRFYPSWLLAKSRSPSISPGSEELTCLLFTLWHRE